MSLPTLFLPPQACTQVAAELPVWQVDGDICSQRPFAEALPDAARAWRLVLLVMIPFGIDTVRLSIVRSVV